MRFRLLRPTHRWGADAELSPRVRTGRVLVLHRQPPEPAQSPPDGSYRRVARSGAAHASPSSVHHRRHGGAARHIHAVWTLPPRDADFSLRWRLIKIDFAKAVPKTEWRSPVRVARGERAVWQRRFWEHLIRDEEDFRRHVEYCYINPVRHGLVARVRDWPHSSFHRDVQAELFPEDWAGDVSTVGSYGERV